MPEGDIEETSKDPASEDEVIELVDVVEEGDVLEDLDVDSELDGLTIAMDGDELGEGESDDLTIAMESENLFDEIREDETDDLTIAMESDDFFAELDEEEPELTLDVDSTSEISLEGLESSEELDFEESDLESLAEVEGDEESILELEDLVEPEDIEGGEAEQDDDLLEDDDSSLAPDSDLDTPLEALELSEQADQEPDIQEVDSGSSPEEEPSLGLKIRLKRRFPNKRLLLNKRRNRPRN